LRVQCGGAAGTPAAIAELADDHGIDWSAGLAVPRSPKSASWQARGLWRILHDAAEAQPSAGGPDPPSRGNGTGARFWPRSRIRRTTSARHSRSSTPRCTGPRERERSDDLRPDRHPALQPALRLSSDRQLAIGLRLQRSSRQQRGTSI
jgi:hypothetical protein